MICRKPELRQLDEYMQQKHNISRMSLEANADIEGKIKAFNEFVNEHPDIASTPRMAASANGRQRRLEILTIIHKTTRLEYLRTFRCNNPNQNR